MTWETEEKSKGLNCLRMRIQSYNKVCKCTYFKSFEKCFMFPGIKQLLLQGRRRGQTSNNFQMGSHLLLSQSV